MKDARATEEEKIWQTEQSEHRNPHHPAAPTSLSRGHWLFLEGENFPHAGATCHGPAHPLSALCAIITQG